eukprot:SRR837773.23204.p2 GENE.SRR837773.23204~~SRR837773.23204.p2  ORF type:complete len:152 (+),score=2.42 SRR837773.23204:56-457(+)
MIGALNGSSSNSDSDTLGRTLAGVERHGGCGAPWIEVDTSSDVMSMMAAGVIPHAWLVPDGELPSRPSVSFKLADSSNASASTIHGDKWPPRVGDAMPELMVDDPADILDFAATNDGVSTPKPGVEPDPLGAV